ncbi:hypothetical protein SZ47_00120 [Brachyspira hyodysenteriae]|uniref:Uncharacterized protein n=2 Tax=Brachyspira hyodysenteriae TaxID=159 RepID=A0A3B6W9F9_BRAHO|nr:hypothetical protein BHYOB78_08125 [Brachyspira hyodysenteriae ATCC 27164]KLI29205.1 hypothetical protein SZ47_00120 [Brachyspira hyodysenteriae]KLI55392.1 hypothetical protein SZ44_13175 [Brachyspira hyodysenteriae]TVL74728.1 hypothetical protein A9X77_11570 [Brachyspira hyodysenteriae]TVL81549.1 hypothetical protein A9X80_00690 [Brachyspira hyodysenteriae]
MPYTNTERYLAYGTQSVGKRTGGMARLCASSKATINNKIEKIKLTKYSYLGMIKTLIYILI